MVVDPFILDKTISLHVITYCSLKVTLQFHSTLHITSVVKAVSSNNAQKIKVMFERGVLVLNLKVGKIYVVCVKTFSLSDVCVLDTRSSLREGLRYIRLRLYTAAFDTDIGFRAFLDDAD
jgi:hypothetical protein